MEGTRQELETLIPHRRTMLLLTRMVSAGPETAVSEVDIDTDTEFYDAEMGGVPHWVCVEYMAQTVAAWVAAARQAESGGAAEPRVGFLLGVRNYDVQTAVFTAGTTYRVVVEKLVIQDGFGTFACRMFADEAVVASARLNVYEPETLDAFREETQV